MARGYSVAAGCMLVCYSSPDISAQLKYLPKKFVSHVYSCDIKVPYTGIQGTPMSFHGDSICYLNMGSQAEDENYFSPEGSGFGQTKNTVGKLNEYSRFNK